MNLLTSEKHKYRMPAEWETHLGTLLAWPSNKETWINVKNQVCDSFVYLMARISGFEPVFLSVNPDDDKKWIVDKFLEKKGVKENLTFLDIPNNDAWVRDYGPCYVRDLLQNNYVINDWNYNAWGGKYPPWDLDRMFCERFAKWKNNISVISHEMVLEGGSIDVNGEGLLMTTRSCLLNRNRNPKMSFEEIENYLKKYLGIDDIIWLEDGISGDDTDGHIDDFARFISPDKIVCCVESDRNNADYFKLEKNFEILASHPVLKRNQVSLFKLPVPAVILDDNLVLPASYANFLFCEGGFALSCF